MSNPKLIKLIENTIRFQTLLADLIRGGIFIGAVYPSLLDHMNDESNYFLSKIKGNGYYLEDEVSFWLDHHKGETAVAGKLLDPKEEKLENIIKDYDKYIEELSTNPSILDEMKGILNDYEKIFRGVPGNINIGYPLLVQHALREGRRAQEIFRWFAKNA